MPLTEAQKDLIVKLDGGQSILDEIETDIAAGIAPLKIAAEKATAENATLRRENVERKRWEQEFRAQMKQINLDPNKPILDLIEGMQANVKSSVTKDYKPNAEVDALNKKLQETIKRLDAEAELRKESDRKAKIATAKGVFAPKMPDHFGMVADLLLKQDIADGIITTDENGEPGVKVGDVFTPFNEGDGAAAMNALRQLHPQYAVVKQKNGPGDTTVKGGDKNSKAKMITNADFVERVAKGEDFTKFFSEGGQVVAEL